MRYQDCLHSIRQLNEQFRYYKSIESLVELDQWSMLPPIPDCDPEQMERFAQRLVRELGYSPPERGSFNNRVVHAFTSFMGPRDARISTYRNGSYNLIFTYLHEAGHAMYASGSSQEIIDAGLWGGVEGGFHEANARFFENMVGHSRAYWSHYYPQLQAELAPFCDISLDAFYAVTHQVRPTPRRISSDEVTYSLHAILRFELERDYFAGELSADDMAQAWNDKYERYLGIRPQNDTEVFCRTCTGWAITSAISRAMRWATFTQDRFCKPCTKTFWTWMPAWRAATCSRFIHGCRTKSGSTAAVTRRAS